MSKGTNTGDCNTGYRNTGNYNTGDNNTGNRNSGNYNSGYYNTGDCNSGNYNTGDNNSGDFNSGAFNRDSPKMRLFEKELDITAEEFYSQYNIYMDIPLNRWVDSGDMTKEEKKEVEGWKDMGGYLKALDYKEACRTWWSENPDDHVRFLSLPGFDWEIFTDITGIEQETEEEIEIDGKKFSKSTIKNALKEYVG